LKPLALQSRGGFADLWYYIDDWGIHGPIQKNQLLRQLEKNFIQLETLVWSEGMEDWIPLSETGLQTGGTTTRRVLRQC
jgi:GYF domain 2